jgi:hypothetical protein
VIDRARDQATSVTDPATPVRPQLLIYRFGADARFEGQLGGAIERIESGGALRILGALFVANDPATGELVAINLRGDGAGGIIAPLLDFRLDPGARRRASRRAFSDGAAGISGDTLRELGRSLSEGEAVAALLVKHVWAEALEDAVGRIGGHRMKSEFVEPDSFGALASDLVAAAAGSS